ncbi:hypothetical protein [Kineococcus sp. SYSU DK006]|uniref:hypothetical protein n=1 Tax=Kineococcus sp. SYSU DK006 TaxID=3383127 RepID=UPI003D7C76E6
MSTSTAPAHPSASTVLDLREEPLEALHRAYEQRWRLLAEDAPDTELTRNAELVRSLEQRCRPGRRLPRRSGPDPATFLG